MGKRRHTRKYGRTQGANRMLYSSRHRTRRLNEALLQLAGMPARESLGAEHVVQDNVLHRSPHPDLPEDESTTACTSSSESSSDEHSIVNDGLVADAYQELMITAPLLSSDFEPSSSAPESSATSDSDADDGEGVSDFKSRLAQWAVDSRIAHVHIDSLLKVMKLEVWGKDLPVTAKTLLQSPRVVSNVVAISPGHYRHFGLESGLLRSLKLHHPPRSLNTLKILINCDGLPLAKSSGSVFWPIVGLIVNVDGSQPFLIGLYHGNSKPSDANEYLSQFVEEALRIQGEVAFSNVKFKLKFAFCLDTQARKFVTYTKGHTGTYSCSRCVIEGESHDHRIVFCTLDDSLRTDEDFRRRSQPEHHFGRSILENLLDVDMIWDFPLDPMHLIYLGVARKILLFWFRGSLKVRLGKRQVDVLCDRLESLRCYCPREFARKPRSLRFLLRWKATEFRQFLLYTGPVVLRGIVSRRVYNNFIVLHTAVKLLSEPEWCYSRNNYAKELLEFFVKEARNLYGVTFLTYNVHNLLHIAQDVCNHGHLERFSAFPFENFLQSLKRMLRTSVKPLQQIAGRIAERESNIRNNPRLNSSRTVVKLFDEHDRGPCPDVVALLKQFRRCFYRNLTLTVSQPDNAVYLTSSSVGLIENFFANDRGFHFAVIRCFRVCQDLYTYPCNSSYIDIYCVSSLECDVKAVRVEDIVCKAYLIPLPSQSTKCRGNLKYASFPVHLDPNCF